MTARTVLSALRRPFYRWALIALVLAVLTFRACQVCPRLAQRGETINWWVLIVPIVSLGLATAFAACKAIKFADRP